MDAPTFLPHLINHIHSGRNWLGLAGLGGWLLGLRWAQIVCFAAGGFVIGSLGFTAFGSTCAPVFSFANVY